MDGGHEAAGGETEDDAGGEVMFADAVGELEVLVEHCAEGERDGLFGGDGKVVSEGVGIEEEG